jgi:hypothetical protein
MASELSLSGRRDITCHFDVRYPTELELRRQASAKIAKAANLRRRGHGADRVYHLPEFLRLQHLNLVETSRRTDST